MAIISYLQSFRLPATAGGGGGGVGDAVADVTASPSPDPHSDHGDRDRVSDRKVPFFLLYTGKHGDP